MVNPRDIAGNTEEEGRQLTPGSTSGKNGMKEIDKLYMKRKGCINTILSVEQQLIPKSGV